MFGGLRPSGNWPLADRVPDIMVRDVWLHRARNNDDMFQRAWRSPITDPEVEAAFDCKVEEEISMGRAFWIGAGKCLNLRHGEGCLLHE